MGALFMGNKPLLKVDSRVSLVMDTILTLLHANGLPKEDVDVIHCDGEIMQTVLVNSQLRMTQFTGSSKVAELLSKQLSGKIRIEGGGFDWKIIGNYKGLDHDTVCKVCTKDAYSFSGQKCSAQSMVFLDLSLIHI